MTMTDLQLKKELKNLFTVRGFASDVEEAIDYLLINHYNEVVEYVESEDNYGLTFYICGYDGQAQNAFHEYMQEQFYVEVV